MPWGKNWEKLVSLASPPVAISAPKGARLRDVFARKGNDLVHMWNDGTQWSALENLGGDIRSRPAAVSWGPGHIDVFAVNGASRLVHRAWTSAGWGKWETFDTDITASQPAAVSRAPGSIDVFARAKTNELIYIHGKGVEWTHWVSLEGNLASEPAVVSWGPERIDVFARGANDNNLWHRCLTGDIWRPWENLGGNITSTPVVVSLNVNSIDVFARGSENDLRHLRWNGTEWGFWESLGGKMTSPPAATSWGGNRIDVFVRGKKEGVHEDLWHQAWNGSQWTDWEGIAFDGTLAAEVPSAPLSWSPDQIDVLVLDDAMTCWHRTWQAKKWQIPFVVEYQEQMEWCWAAVTVSVARYYNRRDRLQQCALANDFFLQDRCCEEQFGRSKDCNLSYPLDVALREYGHLAGCHGLPISFEEISSEIDWDRPVCVGIRWRDRQVGHFIAIRGYLDDFSGSFYIEDPGWGPSIVTYKTLLNYYQGSGSLHSVYFTKG